MIEIKVLGPGCFNCKKLEELTRSALESLAIEAKVEKVSNYQQIMDLGVMRTPGLVINGKVVSSGRIPSVEEITGWVQEAAAVK